MLKTSFSADRFAAFVLVLVLSLSVFTSCKAEIHKEISKENVTFTDALGREVAVEKNPERTAALIGSLAEVWTLSGGRLCAAPDDAWTDFGLDIQGAVNIGGAHSPVLETLIASNPELVIASASTSSNVEMLSVLERMGITVAFFDVDCFEDYLEMLNVCTDITGRKDLYKTNGTDIKEKIDRIKEKVEKAQLPEKERTVLLLRASSGFVKAKGSEGTVLGEMLRELGCINIADSETALLEKLNAESVILSDPYRIFMVTMGDDTEAAIQNFNELLNSSAAWRELTAVKEGRVHVMERRLFNIKPNAKWAVSYEQLGKILLEE